MQDFLKNNRGINDGADLPEEYMTELYDRIINDEIKMKVRPRCKPRVPFPPIQCLKCPVSARFPECFLASQHVM